MLITLENCSPLARKGWATVSLPRSKAAELPEVCTLNGGRRAFEMVRGASRGLKTYYHVEAAMAGGEVITGTVEPVGKLSRPFRIHPWLEDTYARGLDVQVGVQLMDGTVVWSTKTGRSVLVDSTAASRTWRLTSKITAFGIVADFWFKVFRDDPALPYEGKIVWSDRLDPSPTLAIRHILLRTSEFFTLDFDVAHGADNVTRAQDGRWDRLLLDRPITLQDGAALPLSGMVLCYKDDPAPLTGPDAGKAAETVEQLRGAAGGPILAVCHDWDGAYLGTGHTPRFHIDPPAFDPARWERGAIAQFESSLQFRRGWAAPRPLGLTNDPAKTGGDDDFGAAKGAGAVSLMLPRYLRMMQYSSYAELLRGVQLYDKDLEPLRAASTPNFVTWSLENHWHAGVSPNRLGKLPNPFNAGTGWKPHDDEHRSQLTLAATALLMESYLLENHIEHQTELDLAAYRVVHPEMGAGPTRAQGRSMQTLFQLASVVDDDVAARLVHCITQRLVSATRNPALDVPGPMRVLSYGEPDLRKQVYLDGVLARWTSIWELGLAVVGLYGAYKAADLSDPIVPLFEEACRTLLRYGVRESHGRYFVVADIAYNGGEDVPVEIYEQAGEFLVRDRHAVVTHNTHGVTEWVFAGMMVAVEALGKSHPLSRDVLPFIEHTTRGREATDRLTAEWWAAVGGDFI